MISVSGIFALALLLLFLDGRLLNAEDAQGFHVPRFAAAPPQSEVVQVAAAPPLGTRWGGASGMSEVIENKHATDV